LETNQEPSVWEKGRNVIDFQVSKTIKNIELKFNLKDALAQKLFYFQDLNKNQKFDKFDNICQETGFGQTLSFSLKYNF